MAKSKTPTKSNQHTIVQKGSFYKEIYWFFSLFVLTFLLYINTLGHGFVLDDPLSIALNSKVTSGFSGISDIIAGGYRENNFGGQLYRPVSLIQFAIEWQISPDNPMIHHFFNIFWYSLSIGLIYMVISRWLGSQNVFLPLLAAMFFAVHPIHTEVVANIKSRDELMSVFFILTSFLTWHSFMKYEKSKWLILSVVLYLLALLSKETAITMFPIYGMLAWFVYEIEARSSFTKGLIFVLPVVVLLIIRFTLFGDQSATVISEMDNPIVMAAGFGQRLATSMMILWKYLLLLLLPFPLSSDYSYIVIPLVDFSNWLVWLSIFLHLGAFIYAIMNIKRNRFQSLCILGYMMSISLFSQIPFVIGTMFGERLVYLASFWWIVSVVYLLKPYITSGEQWWMHNKILLLVSFAIVVAFSIMTIKRSNDWKSNLTLFTTDAATYPQSVRLNNGAAEEMVRSSDLISDESEKNKAYEKAEKYCAQIMAVKPVPTAFLTLGNIRMKQGRYEDAIKYYDQVNDLQSIVDVNKALSYRELGRIAGEKEQNLVKSQDMLTKSLKLNDKDAETWYLMGVSYGVSGNHQLAAEHFEKAHANNPTPEYAKNVILAYKNLGNQNKVDQYQKLLGGQ